MNSSNPVLTLHFAQSWNGISSWQDKTGGIKRSTDKEHCFTINVNLSSGFENKAFLQDKASSVSVLSNCYHTFTFRNSHNPSAAPGVVAVCQSHTRPSTIYTRSVLLCRKTFGRKSSPHFCGDNNVSPVGQQQQRIVVFFLRTKDRRGRHHQDLHTNDTVSCCSCDVR